MKRVNNKWIFIFGLIAGILLTATTVYAVEAYIESKKVSYDNHNKKVTTKENVQEAIDELYERSGIHQEKWVDPILNGADPVLKDQLIPVTIDNDGNVYYANLNSEWYNYSEKRWANAVILIDNPSNKNYKTGDHILEDDIESYFVWIPRYQYKIWDLGKYNAAYSPTELTNTKDTDKAFWKAAGSNSKLIDIQFGTYEKYPKMAEPTSVGVYYTHPAFTLGSKNLNGFWAGKFEVGGTINNILVVPNVSSLRNTNVKTFFDAAKGYENSLDSHMMRNTEWGAVAYLSHSEYGIGNNININNNSNYKTGYSATASTDQRMYSGEIGSTAEKTKLWNSTIGYLASTTGNISGIYDMSGGAWEYVAGSINGFAGNDGFSADELSSYMNQGYIDNYSNDSTIVSFNKRILGDATGETGPFYFYTEASSIQHSSWYAADAYFFGPNVSWLMRGGGATDGSAAGQFAFTCYSGAANFQTGFRIVISPTK